MVWLIAYVVGCALTCAVMFMCGMGFTLRNVAYSFMWPLMLVAVAISFVDLLRDDGTNDLEEEYCKEDDHP
jgi:hypothetical protein